ncbi:hypothetical protein BRADI_1g35270v3 [Brachypodium distachyon]|uniref:Knottin scorpion toxin-like domain-containing protein n=1 Tax=Brachypodium distachyon TaxID=15368 RepID=I1GX23_BRADI|nr:hypothetical protein BRADI_1g35270v3 [Brachypodium distachyon]
MRPFFSTMLLALALVLLCSGVATKAAIAKEGDGARVVPMDCKVLPPKAGACDPKKCYDDCSNAFGRGIAVGECVAGGCQCTYCLPSRGPRS